MPGIGHSPDKMLQVRIFSYADAHRYRLGVNYESLPVNRPRCPVHNYHRDGAMRFDGNGGGSGRTTSPTASADRSKITRFNEPPLTISGDADRYDHRAGNDDYGQAGDLFRLMSAGQQQQLIGQHRWPRCAACRRRSSAARSAISPRPIRPMALGSHSGWALAP